jgi:hypothetical protein
VYDAAPEHEYGSPPALSPAQLLDVACARAAGLSWEAAVSRLNLPMTPGELCRACLDDDRYDGAYEKADRDHDREADAELRASLRAGLRDPDPAARGRAQERLGLHLRAKSRDATRLKVEAMRADVQRARIEAQARRDAERAAERAAEQAAEAPLTDEEWREAHERRMARYASCEQLYEDQRRNRPHWDQAARFDWTPEEYGRFIAEARAVSARNERLNAEDASRWGRVVWLWGGRHPIGGHPPDETDRPVYLRADHTCAAKLQQVFYWAVPNPPPTDTTHGPFPPPPGAEDRGQGSGVREQESEQKAQATPDAPPG